MLEMFWSRSHSFRIAIIDDEFDSHPQFLLSSEVYEGQAMSQDLFHYKLLF